MAWKCIKDMEKIRITESQLSGLIEESVKKYLTEIGDTPTGAYALGRVAGRAYNRADNNDENTPEWDKHAKVAMRASGSANRRYRDDFNKGVNDQTSIINGGQAKYSDDYGFPSPNPYLAALKRTRNPNGYTEEDMKDAESKLIDAWRILAYWHDDNGYTPVFGGKAYDLCWEAIKAIKQLGKYCFGWGTWGRHDVNAW